MKKLAALLFLPALLAFSPTAAVADDDAEARKICANAEEIAETFGQARYRGVPIEDIRAITAKVEDPDERQFYEAIANNVYKLPMYDTEQEQQKAIKDKATEMYVLCFVKLTGILQ